MAGYGIEDVPHVELSNDAAALLGTENTEQAALMAEAVIRFLNTTWSWAPCQNSKRIRVPVRSTERLAFFCSTRKAKCCSSNGRRTK